MTGHIGAPNSIMRKFTEMPEPNAPQVNYSISTSTPWGKADSSTKFAKGIVFYSTPSHGGFHLSASRLKQVPEFLQTADKYADGTKGWFEEDCAAAIVTVCFPEFFTREQRLAAIAQMQSCYAAQWAEFLQSNIG